MEKSMRIADERDPYALTKDEWYAAGVLVLCLLAIVVAVYVIAINPAVDAGVLAGR